MSNQLADIQVYLDEFSNGYNEGKIRAIYSIMVDLQTHNESIKRNMENDYFRKLYDTNMRMLQIYHKNRLIEANAAIIKAEAAIKIKILSNKKEKLQLELAKLQMSMESSE